MPRIDLNSDLGEGLGPEIDDALLGLVSSANVACGGHAGDEASMRRTVRVAIANGVRIGAHPSYPDLQNFGRLRMAMTAERLEDSLTAQIDALSAVAREEGTSIAYIKPHGALYNDAVAGNAIAEAVLDEIAARWDLPLMILPGTGLERTGTVGVIREGFLDRAYAPDGTLVPRSEPGALITSEEGVREQALVLAPRVDSLSLHSDTPGAVELMRAARHALTEAGFEIAAS